MTKPSRKLVSVAVAISIGTFSVPPMAAANVGQDGRATASAADTFTNDKPLELRPLYKRLYLDGEWGAVLNLNQLGLAAMEMGQWDVAKRAFDEAIARIDQVYANDENAKKALSMFSEEKIKDFKGEPYERAMTYYYRALLYLREGDYQNARAALLAADLQDTLSEKETYAGDFGLMKYLAGWASMCDGEAARGRTLIEEAKRADATIAAFPDNPGRAVTLIDSGRGPRKIAKGEYKHLLAFEAGTGPDANVVLRQAGATTSSSLLPAADLYYQASTRGGRQVDTVLNGKAQFKGDMNAAGDVATGVGLGLISAGGTGDSRGVAGAGAIIGLLSLIAKSVSAATTPGADTRQWSSLPASVLIAVDDGQATGPLTMVSSALATEQTLPLQAAHGNCRIAWGRTRSALPVSFGGEAVIVDGGSSHEQGREQKNVRFRQMLQTEFAAAVRPPAGVAEADTSSGSALTTAR